MLTIDERLTNHFTNKQLHNKYFSLEKYFKHTPLLIIIASIKYMTTRIAAFVWTIFILVASLLPKEAMPRSSWTDFANFDKLSHLVSYGILVFLWSKLLSAKVGKVKGARIAFYGSITLGLLMEFLQWQMNSGRYFEILDIIANIIGSIIGLTAFYKIIKH